MRRLDCLDDARDMIDLGISTVYSAAAGLYCRLTRRKEASREGIEELFYAAKSIRKELVSSE